MDIDSQLHLPDRVNKVSLYSTIQSLSVAFWHYLFEKNLVLKVFILHKENSCIKKILIINFLSAIYVVFLSKHSNFSYLRNVSANNGVKYLPYTFLLNWVLMCKNTNLSEIEIFVVLSPSPIPSLPCPMLQCFKILKFRLGCACSHVAALLFKLPACTILEKSCFD